MSRTCMYCGRELAKGEHCTCPQSERMRQAKKQSTGASSDGAAQSAHSQTASGAQYSQAQSAPPPKSKKTWRERREERRRTRPVKNRPHRTAQSGGAREFFSYILSCVRTPVFKASNPGYVRMWWVWVLIGIQGFVVSMALALSNSTLGKGLFGILSMTLGFKGVAGWKNLANILVAAVSGTAMGYIQFFILCAIFFLLGKLTVRSTSGFREYMERFAPCSVPMTVVGILGVVFAVFSPSMLLLLLACGAVFEVILLYEALRAQWHAQPDFMVYTIAGGLFVYAVLCYNIYKLLI